MRYQPAFALLAAAALALPATAKDRTPEAPTVIASTRTPLAVANCLALKLGVPVMDSDNGDRLIYGRNMFGKAKLVFTVRPAGSGAQVIVTPKVREAAGTARKCAAG